MPLEMPAFTPTRLQEERDADSSRVFTIRMSKEELKEFEEAARTLQQEKISTTVKQLARLGMLVLHDQKTRYVLDTVFKNKRNNERIGIATPNPDFVQM